MAPSCLLGLGLRFGLWLGTVRNHQWISEYHSANGSAHTQTLALAGTTNAALSLGAQLWGLDQYKQDSVVQNIEDPLRLPLSIRPQ